MPIRHPAPLSRLEHLTKTVDKDMSLYEYFDIKFIQDVYTTKKFKPDPGLVVRLGRMNTLRRRLFRYRKTHMMWLKSEIDRSQAQHFNSEPTTEAIPDQVDIPELQKNEEETSSISQSTTRRMVSSKATTLRLNHNTDYLQGDGNHSEAGTDSSNATAQSSPDMIVIPPRPKGLNKEDLTEFECQYCYVACHVESLRDWTKHIIRDLEPYVCTFGNCDRANDTFSSRSAWYEHECQQHRLDYSCNTTGHEPFTNVAEFRSHMLNDHKFEFDDDRLPSQLSMFQRPNEQKTRVCPLCGQAKLRLKGHLARHLERIAIFSLPKNPILYDESVLEDSDCSVQKNRSSVGEGAKVVSKGLDAEQSTSSSTEMGEMLANEPGLSSNDGYDQGNSGSDTVDEVLVPDTDDVNWDIIPIPNAGESSVSSKTKSRSELPEVPISLSFRSHPDVARILVMGPNGCGKEGFIRMLGDHPGHISDCE